METENIPFQLNRISIGLRAASEKTMVKIGHHAAQSHVLIALSDGEALSQVELSNRLGVAAATINVMVKKLCQAGFTKCTKCPDDARIVKVELTQAGKASIPEIKEKFAEIESLMMKDLTETEKIILPLLLSKLAANLSEPTPSAILENP